MMKKLVAVALASAGLIVHAEFAVTSVRGSGKTVYGLSVSFDATDEDRLLFCASGATDGGDDLNAWDDFFRVSVPAGATSAEVACPAPIDMTSSKVRFFFAPTTVTACDALLEFVEATGTQYIDTGVYASGPKTAAHARFAYPAESKTDQILFGARSDDSDTLAFHFSFQVNSGNQFAFNCKDLIHNTGSGKKPTAGAIYTVTLDSPNRLALVQDNAGSDVYRYTIPSEWPHVRTATRTMLAFADHGYGTPCGFASARLYALDICEDGGKVRDYTPAVCGGAVGLYDAVENTFSPSASGTAFLGGAKVANATITGATSASETLTELPDGGAVGTVVTVNGDADGKRDVIWTLTGYGINASAAATVKIVYSKNADYADAQEVAAGENISEALPYSATTVLSGLDEQTKYFCKLVVVNDAGVEAAIPFEFVEQDNAETYYWVNENGGEWNEPTNWRIGSKAGAVPTDYPKECDIVRFETSGEYDISLSEDVTVDKFYFWHTGKKAVRMFMNGHLLRAKTYFNHRSALEKDNSPSLITYIGGQLTCDAVPVTKNGVASSGFWVDGEGNSGTERGLMNLSGSMLSLTNNFTIAGNRSEVFFENQSTCQVSRAMGKNLTLNGSSRLYVDNSHVEANMFVANTPTVTEFRNGATFEIGGFFLNGGETYPRVTIDCATGTVYSANASGNSGSIRLNCGGAAHNSYFLITNHAQVICNARVTVGSYNGGTTSPCGQTNGWLVVADGSLLDSYAHNDFQQVGQNKGCLCHLAVDDATVRFSRLQIGNQTTSTNNVLHISGRHPLLKCERAITYNSGSILKNAALVACATSLLDFSIPAGGYAETPVQVTGLFQTIASTQADLTDEKVRLAIDADAFARSDPNTTLPLITATLDSSAAYGELMDNFTYLGKERYKGTLSVSDDGKTLFYTTPKAQGMMLLLR